MRVSVVTIPPDGSLLRLPEETPSICRLYWSPRAAATKKVWFPPLKRDTLLFLCSTLLAGDTLKLHAVVPVLQGVQAGLGHLGPGAGHGGAGVGHVSRVMVPRVPVRRDTWSLHLTVWSRSSSGHSLLISQQADVGSRAWPLGLALERIHKCYTTDSDCDTELEKAVVALIRYSLWTSRVVKSKKKKIF